MKIFRCLRPILLALCALTLPLAACKKRAPEFAPETLAALQAVEETDWEEHNINAQAVAEVLEAYRETGDPNTGADEGLTILDLACAARQQELAEYLLKQGADARKGSPLKVLLWTTPTDDDAEVPPQEEERTIEFIDFLTAHGADVNGPAFNSILSTAAMVSTEAVFLHLLDKGAKVPETEEIPTGGIVVARAWNEALRRLIEMKAPLSDGAISALHIATGKDDAEEHAETMRILLEAGADVNALDAKGQTPLFCLARALEADPTEDDRECLRLLLEHGATVTEPEVPYEEYGMLTAYDFLASHPSLLAELREEGYVIPEQPLVIREEEEYLFRDLMRAELRLSNHPQAAELLKPYIPLLVKVLTQHRHGADGEVAGATFSLLCQADKGLAEQVLPTLRLWDDTREWDMKNGTFMPVGVEILSVITERAQDKDAEPLALPKDKILHLIELFSAQQSEEAPYAENQLLTDIAELLEYAPGAEEDIERLSKDESHPAVQLGAMTAKLHLAGLPDAKASSAEAWLGDVNAACLPPSVMKVLRLTDLETFWFGEMDATDRAALIADIESLGLYTVADIYRKALPDELTDDELADIMEEAAEHATELELAVARFILDNRKDFEASKK